MTWQVDVPMIATIRPGRTASAAAAVTWASTLPTATAMPSGRPVQAAASAVSVPGEAAEGLQVVAQLGGEVGETGVERGQELAGRVAAVLVDALVARRADVAGLPAGEPPDDPVGGLDPPFGQVVQVGVLFEQLQPLRELPLGGDLAAVAAQPRLAALGGQGVDPVRVRLRGVVLPELRPRVRPVGVQLAERRPVRGGRQDRARGEVRADADDLGGGDPGDGEGLRHGEAQHVQPVPGA